jgi:transposase-like protein
MNVHKNARLTPRGRERIVRQVANGQAPEAVAQAAGVCPRTVRKWVDRYRREGLAGLQDRSSRPHQLRQSDAPGRGQGDRAAASSALDGQADLHSASPKREGRALLPQLLPWGHPNLRSSENLIITICSNWLPGNGLEPSTGRETTAARQLSKSRLCVPSHLKWPRRKSAAGERARRAGAGRGRRSSP